MFGADDRIESNQPHVASFDRGAAEYRAVFTDGPPEVTLVETREGQAPQAVSLPPTNPYEVELASFVGLIQGTGDPSLLDGERAVEALRLSLATQASLRSGRVVPIG